MRNLVIALFSLLAILGCALGPEINGQTLEPAAKTEVYATYRELAAPVSVNLIPGCGFKLADRDSCWKETKSGSTSAPKCARANLATDPWLVSSATTGQPLRAYPNFDLPQVADAGNRRWGWRNPRPPGYWPLGGPVNEPWAESLPTLGHNLRWACDHYGELPQSIKALMGSPETHDMVFHPRETYDLVFIGGARDINRRIIDFRNGGPPAPPPPQSPPTKPPPQTPPPQDTPDTPDTPDGVPANCCPRGATICLVAQIIDRLTGEVDAYACINTSKPPSTGRMTVEVLFPGEALGMETP